MKKIKTWRTRLQDFISKSLSIIEPTISSHYLYQKDFLFHLLHPHSTGAINWTFRVAHSAVLHYVAGFLTPAAEKHSCRYLHAGIQASEFNIGRLLLDPKFRNFRNGDIWYGNFLGKVPENVEVVEFPKSEPFNRKFRKFRDENQMERTFPGKYVPKFGFTPQGCPLFGNSANSRFAIQR